MPSREQIEAFAYFVPRAHSWYKGPLLPVDAGRMTFFLYPAPERRGQQDSCL
jgi:hypothetical protein